MKSSTEKVSYKTTVPVFTDEMKKTYTILAPDMLPYHFDIISVVLKRNGYNVEILRNESHNVIEEGLKHVHNDACFPALCVTGQFNDGTTYQRLKKRKIRFE